MYLDINKVGHYPSTIDRCLDISVVMSEGSAPVDVRDVRLAGCVERVERGVELTARLTATLGLQCSRCLGPFEQALDTEVGLTLVHASPFSACDTALSESDAALFHAPEGKADLGDIASEQIHLNLELKPLCCPDCKGLCPACGGNRNRLECGCTNEQLDARLAPLLEFKKRLRGS